MMSRALSCHQNKIMRALRTRNHCPHHHHHHRRSQHQLITSNHNKLVTNNHRHQLVISNHHHRLVTNRNKITPNNNHIQSRRCLNFLLTFSRRQSLFTKTFQTMIQATSFHIKQTFQHQPMAMKSFNKNNKLIKLLHQLTQFRHKPPTRKPYQLINRCRFQQQSATNSLKSATTHNKLLLINNNKLINRHRLFQLLFKLLQLTNNHRSATTHRNLNQPTKLLRRHLLLI